MHSDTIPDTQADFGIFEKALRDRIVAARFGRTGKRAGIPTPKASVIVLNYNGERVLERCLRSICAQDYPNFEVLVVENGSTDRSRAIIEEFAAGNPVKLIQSPSNLGVAAGRNLGFARAVGEVTAFVDNDGYPAEDWLFEAVAKLLSDDSIGAVSSLVCLDRRKLMVNGIGGFLDAAGSGGDLGFGFPIEFVPIEPFSLFPMGCGMVFRTELLRSIMPLDTASPKWFDDTELGIRVHLKGMKVAAAPRAIVDHGWHGYEAGSVQPGWRQALGFEQARIRTVLKYFSRPDIARWLYGEIKSNISKPSPAHSIVLLLAWAWNFLHAFSLLRLREKYREGLASMTAVYSKDWGRLAVPLKRNMSFQPKLNALRAEVCLGSHEYASSLNYGWSDIQCEGGIGYRTVDLAGSALLQLDTPAASLAVRYRTHSDGVLLRLRKPADLECAFEAFLPPTGSDWQSYQAEISAEPATYELIVAHAAPLPSVPFELHVAEASLR